MAWHCKNDGYYYGNVPVSYYPDADGLENCDQIYYILKGKGWTTNAICGLLTCVALECGYNPWKWEGSMGYDRMHNLYAVEHDEGEWGDPANWPDYYGYGIVQWTPASYMNDRYHREHPNDPRPNKYISNPNAVNIPGYGPNFKDAPGSTYDGYAQTIFLDAYGGDQQYYDSYNYYGHLCPTYDDFKVSTLPASDLCETWTQNFERAAGSYDPDKRAIRQTLANALWNNYNGKPVLPPDTPGGGGGGFPAWLILKWRQANLNRRW